MTLADSCINHTPVQNVNETDDIKMLKLWHPTLNGALKPSDITSGSSRKVWWQCEKGHAWQARAYSVKDGSGCPYCFGRYAIPGKTDLATTHPDILRLWSPKNKLSPDEVTAGSHKKILWVCEKGHEWEALVTSVAAGGCGCPYCAGKKAIPGETDLATLKPEIMPEWDFEKNTLNPCEIAVASHDKVWWKCALGHSWQAVVFSRTKENASGCPYCTGRKVLPGFNDMATLKPKLAKEWHQALNGKLKPEEVTLGSNKKVWWQCREGHTWQAFIYARTKPNGTGCPVCAGMVKQSNFAAELIQRPRSSISPRKRVEQTQVGINI